MRRLRSSEILEKDDYFSDFPLRSRKDKCEIYDKMMELGFKTSTRHRLESILCQLENQNIKHKKNFEKLLESFLRETQMYSESDYEDCQALVRKDKVKDVFMNLHSMLKDGTFSDISIKCGSEVLRAHKVIVSARSPVFKAMFTSPMQESQTDTVVIDDIDHSTMTIMLDFMYNDQVEELSVSMASNLLYASQKYQIDDLKNVCVQYLLSNLSNQNAFEILQAADLYDEKLKACVMSFISKNFNSLKRSKEWKCMQSSHPSLAMEVYSFVVNKLQEKINN